MVQSRFIGYTSALISTVLLGSVGILVRNITVNEYVLTFIRMLLSCVFLVIFLLFRREIKLVQLQSFSLPVFLSGATSSLAILCYMNAINDLTLAQAAFLLFLGPLIATGLATITLKERLTVSNFIPLLLAFIGFLSLMKLDFSFGSADSDGYWWGLGAGFCYALYIVFNRQIPNHIGVSTRSFYQFLVGAIVLIPFLDQSVFQIGTVDWGWLLAISFFQGFIALTLIVVAVKNLKVVEYGTISYVEPLIAAMVGFSMYDEVLTPIQFIGCVCILVAGIVQMMFSDPAVV